MTASELITAPVAEPITLAEAKAFLRVETVADDTLVTALIVAARGWAEQFTNRVFVTQTWRLWLDQWPCGNSEWWDGMREESITHLAATQAVTLPKASLQSVSSITTYADDDTANVWASSNYFTDTASKPGRVIARGNAGWPQPSRMANGICIEYVAGYGNAAAVPETIKTAIKQLVAHWYEHRGEAVAGSFAPPPLTVTALLLPYRLQGLTL